MPPDGEEVDDTAASHEIEVTAFRMNQNHNLIIRSSLNKLISPRLRQAAMCHRRKQRLPRHSLEMAHLLANYIRPTRRRPSRQANLLTCRPDSADESRLESPVLV